MSPMAGSPLSPVGPDEGIVVVLANVELDVDTLAGDLMQAARL